MFFLSALVALKPFILKKRQPKNTKFGKEGFTKDFGRLLFSRHLIGLSIKIESTVLKSTRWKILGRVGLLFADIGLLIDGTNFVLALVLLQCSKRTSWLSSDFERCISRIHLHWSHKIADYCRGLHLLLNWQSFVVRLDWGITFVASNTSYSRILQAGCFEDGHWSRPNTVRCEVSGQTSFVTHAAE